ncbi:GNAT family N-acetyltransferase [Ruminococcus sp.]|uniref:GNAT family N-acetyltransferase n=1 Tax=Ruminococcus sp. TaxID=41978 RepID=UPI0025EC8D59|nr:GNAT family N-acetyltransferase [Ruminococcus sp.]MBQ6250537.1 GNAT family N-acetyltransferase [Ruminococcus sp.]MBR3665905.1 GNAT family N-acetyltransferase [Ruminococcus sp.]
MIRRYRQDDLDGAAEVFRCAFMAEPWKEAWSRELAAERISQLMSAPQSVGYVSEANGTIQAILCGRKLTYLHGTEYVIDEFCVSPSVQRQGTGTAVMEYAAYELRREGVVAMALMTTRGYPSERFYLKNGFEGIDGMVFMYRSIKENVNDKT